MKKILDEATKEIAKNRLDIIAKLLQLAKTDLLFFWGEKKDLYTRQQKEWQPILDWAEKELRVNLQKTDTLEVPENEALQNPLGKFLNNLSDKELACYYAATLNMRSIILAMALVKQRINADEAGRLSCLEELWQNEIWGVDEEALSRRQVRCDELKEIESYLLA